MRIIAGSAKGGQILSVPKSKPVKPISSRIKQSVFDILRPRVTGSFFLDLFAGTGAVGLEALSRGAQKVFFIEREKFCLNVIDKNIARLGFAEKAKTFKADVTSNLSWLKLYCEEGFDIVFLSPPYRDAKDKPLSLTGKTLAAVCGGNILSERGIAVAQHHCKEDFAIPQGFTIFRQEKYGDTLVDFLRKSK
ncbi:MAG: 16S rRNA (guanine(966)-N(2))-methyltransferase RsmD [Elusimicrobia bacterium]|nr:16S rRNA (guanine(966)-N(2))-methyltransferase RsmD [Elusimicrobiota bacterium]